MIDLARRDGTGCWPSRAGSRHPDGGFAWLRTDGTPDLERPRELWITTRMTHVFALGAARGERGSWSRTGSPRCATTSATPSTAAGSRRRAAGRQARLRARLRRAGGGQRGRRRAARRGAGGARDALLGRVRGRAGRRRGTATGRGLEPYRGANANMHGVEALLATGDPLWRERAARIDAAARRRQPPALNEHFDAGWRPLPDYNHRRPRAPVPALRRDDRALVRVGAAGVRARRLRGRRAAAVRRRACTRAGTARASSTRSTGTAGRSSATTCTGCCARRSPPPRCSARTRCERRVVGARRARLHRPRRRLLAARLDASNRPSSDVWDGKPDVYHALGAIDASLHADVR